MECDFPAEGAVGRETRPAAGLAEDLGACFACPEKLYRLAALAEGLRLAPSAAGRWPEAGRAGALPLRDSGRLPFPLPFAAWEGFAGWLPFPLLKPPVRAGRAAPAAVREPFPLAEVLRGMGGRRRSPLAAGRDSPVPIPEPIPVRLRSRGWAAAAVLVGRGRGIGDFPEDCGLPEDGDLPACDAATAGRGLGAWLSAEIGSRSDSDGDSDINSDGDSFRAGIAAGSVCLWRVAAGA